MAESTVINRSEERSLYSVAFSDLEQELSRFGISKVHARALWQTLYRDLDTALPARRDLAPPLQRWIADEAEGTGKRGWNARLADEMAEVQSSDGLTRKYLLRLGDGREVESVLMAFPGRFTACLSTQAGCAMGCVFCATGQMGFARHLRADEIVGQVVHCQRGLRERGMPGLRNLALMGMGEPLHNYDAVMEALEIVSDRRGLNIGPGHITISTVGVVPGILRMAKENRPYHLAVSLHGATEASRAALVPASRHWPLAELIEACRAYQRETGRKILFEWTLIRGVNDSPAVAEELSALLRGLRAHVNLIPLNPTSAFDAAPSDLAVSFQRVLRSHGFPSTVRQRRGIDVSAGCGQLRTNKG